MKEIATLLILLLITTGCTVQTEESRKTVTESTVTEVVDGDTVEIQMGGSTETVRLLGIDTPEVHVENNPSEYEKMEDTEKTRKCLKTYGEKASDLAKEKLSGKKINFTTDPQSDIRGSYGRLLGYIEVNGTDFNLHLIEKGYARVYHTEFTRKEEYLQAEETAQEQLKGLWQCRSYEVNNLTVRE